MRAAIQQVRPLTWGSFSTRTNRRHTSRFFRGRKYRTKYTYDVFNRRIAKYVDADGDAAIDETTYYVNDGPRESRAGAGDHVLLTRDAAGATTHRYLHGPEVDQIFADEDASGDVLWPLTDNLGTVRDLADYDSSLDVTEIANHIAYDAFGNVTSETNAAVDHIFGYTGRERDAESGLQYNRARYYDPAVAKFVSDDPIGFEAGDANLSRYVQNYVTVMRDPSGLEEHLEIAAHTHELRDAISSLEQHLYEMRPQLEAMKRYQERYGVDNIERYEGQIKKYEGELAVLQEKLASKWHPTWVEPLIGQSQGQKT